jgi:uncharacterized membrane protein
MTQTQRGKEEGQIIPALLLAVVAILFFGLLFVQVGSAAEQKTQTQTATDSAAVASAHQFRDYTIANIAPTIPYSFNYLFQATRVTVFPQFQSIACNAAETNWAANPHKGTAIDCGGSLSVASTGSGVRVDLTTPADQVVGGPAKVADQRATATATANVAFAHCPGLYDGNDIHKAVADWILDASLASIGANHPRCFTGDDITALQTLNDLSFGQAAAAVGPPQPILDAVRGSTRVEIVD